MTSELGFCVRPVEGFKLSLRSASTAEEAVPVVLQGPPDLVNELSELQLFDGEVLGTLAPLSRITVEREGAEAIGIASGAAYFAFFYPLCLTDSHMRQLTLESHAAHGRLSQAVRKPSELHMTPAWLDLILVGGFVYFDSSLRLLHANALSLPAPLSLSSLESCFAIRLIGPYVATNASVVAMGRSGRMLPTTVDALKELGFASFGWVNPAELFDGGHARCLSGQRRLCPPTRPTWLSCDLTRDTCIRPPLARRPQPRL